MHSYNIGNERGARALSNLPLVVMFQPSLCASSNISRDRHRAVSLSQAHALETLLTGPLRLCKHPAIFQTTNLCPPGLKSERRELRCARRHPRALKSVGNKSGTSSVPNFQSSSAIVPHARCVCVNLSPAASIGPLLSESSGGMRCETTSRLFMMRHYFMDRCCRTMASCHVGQPNKNAPAE